jgi:hypothetical protein
LPFFPPLLHSHSCVLAACARLRAYCCVDKPTVG